MFLDNAATTPLKPEVKDYVISLLDTYQNPSSMYQSGVNAKQIINTARKNVAKFININPENIIFTSGGSANNTLFIKGYTQRNECRVLYSPTSHKSVLKCVESLKYKCSLKVDYTGKIDLQDLKECLSIDTMKKLVVIEHANSEIGTIQDIKQIIEMCHFYNAIVYVDCTGSISQIPVDIRTLDIDGLGFSAHKLSALKGVGILYKKKHIELEPLIYGSQEQGLFAGTENVIGIAAGMLDGLGYTALKGALISRGTREVSRLIEVMGGKAVSAYGLCHLGDYEATVFSKYSHNRIYGEDYVLGKEASKLAEGAFLLSNK